MSFPEFSAPGAAAIRRAGELARRSGAVNPAHLLAAVLEVSDPLGEIAGVANAPTGHKGRTGEDPGAAVHYDTLARQAMASAGTWAARRGSRAGPEDLLVVLIDQHSPPVVAALARMGPGSDRLRQAALRMLGLPIEYGPVALEPVPAAGTDQDVMDIEDLPAEAWAALEDRQGRLPLHRVRRRSDWAAVVINERRAALKLAARHGLSDNVKESLLHHHARAVQRLGGEAAPDIVLEPLADGQSDASGGRVTGRQEHGLVPAGWVVWFGNRRIALKATWFRWTVQRY